MISVVLISIIALTIYLPIKVKSLNSRSQQNPLMNPRYSVREQFYGDYGPLKGMEMSDHAFPVNSMKRNAPGGVSGLTTDTEGISSVENQAYFTTTAS
jgi:hypothetical protein